MKPDTYREHLAELQLEIKRLRKTGQWVDDINEDMNPFFRRGWKCTACGMRQTYGRSKYCPNCGARMEVEHG